MVGLVFRQSKLFVLGVILLAIGLAVTLGGSGHPHRVWPFGGRVVLMGGIALLVLWLFERERGAP